MSYWHKFKPGKKVEKPAVPSALPLDVVPIAAPAEASTRAEDADPATSVVEEAAAPVAPPKQKTLATDEFDIDAEADRLAEFVTNLFSDQLHISDPHQRNLHLHFSEVLRRCAYVHLRSAKSK